MSVCCVSCSGTVARCPPLCLRSAVDWQRRASGQRWCRSKPWASNSAGTGRTRLYSVRTEHRLAAPLDALFAAEEDRFTAIRETIRSVASGCGLGVLAAWIYGSVARNADRPDSDMDI